MPPSFTPTDEQQEILDLTSGVHLVLAPPGSGKTSLLAQRAMLAKQHGVRDKDMICLTFTNRAAKIMSERIQTAYPSNQIMVGNIHHFCLKFLLRNRLIPMNASILDEEEAQQLLRDCSEGTKWTDHEYTGAEIIKLAAYLKRQELGFPATFLPNLNITDEKYEEVLEGIQQYIQEKEAHYYFDFDDLLTWTYYHLITKEKRQLQLSYFSWLQVDEVQDLNPLQFEIIDLITDEKSFRVYFGDYEQAIFSFMGSKLDSLQKIQEKVTASHGTVHMLSVNFRSPSYLLNVYRVYAQKNLRSQWEKPIRSLNDQAAPEDALQFFYIEAHLETELQEMINNYVLNLLKKNEQMAILVRFNKEANLLSNLLERQAIPHFKVSGRDFFQMKVNKGLMAFFSIFEKEFDRLSWARLFYEFHAIPTLKASRVFVNTLFRSGLTPIDFVEYPTGYSRLQDFSQIFSAGEMIVFDTETTGLNTEQDDIIQIAAIKIRNGQIQETFEVYLRTEKDLAQTEHIHHISKEHLAQVGVSHKEGLSAFLQFIGNKAVLVAHNIGYDYDILHHNLLRYTNITLSQYCQKQFDTIAIAKLTYPYLRGYTLESLIQELQLDGINSHNALDDVKATVRLIQKIQQHFESSIHPLQQEFLTKEEHQKLIQKFLTNFKEIYSLIHSQLEQPMTLTEASKVYFEYVRRFYPPAHTKLFCDSYKLFNHMDLYTNKPTHYHLQRRIKRYIPEYKLFKESDLYLGTEKILISTVHKAKGLEFDNVIIAGATDNNYPFLYHEQVRLAAIQECSIPQLDDRKFSKEDVDLLKFRKEEEARILYVALTRAKKRIIVTCHGRFKSFQTKHSRFLDCILPFFKQKYSHKS